jgi:serine/threonine protein kinase
MSLSKHPNVLRVRGSWMDGHKLHIALRLMNAGSAADVMQYAWPGGMEEEVVRCILKQALEGLKYVPSDYPITHYLIHRPHYSYLHINGFIHRDVKAANLLIDDDGTVLLGDLGVAAPLNDEDHTPHVHENAKPSRIVVFDKDVNVVPRRSRVGKRRSFVGTVGLFPRSCHVSWSCLTFPLCSHAGWRQSLSLAFSMTRVPIFGLSVSLPSSWRRGVPRGLENPLALCFCRCEWSPLRETLLPRVPNTSAVFHRIGGHASTLLISIY